MPKKLSNFRLDSVSTAILDLYVENGFEKTEVVQKALALFYEKVPPTKQCKDNKLRCDLQQENKNFEELY